MKLFSRQNILDKLNRSELSNELNGRLSNYGSEYDEYEDSYENDSYYNLNGSEYKDYYDHKDEMRYVNSTTLKVPTSTISPYKYSLSNDLFIDGDSTEDVTSTGAPLNIYDEAVTSTEEPLNNSDIAPFTSTKAPLNMPTGAPLNISTSTEFFNTTKAPINTSIITSTGAPLKNNVLKSTPLKPSNTNFLNSTPSFVLLLFLICIVCSIFYLVFFVYFHVCKRMFRNRQAEVYEEYFRVSRV